MMLKKKSITVFILTVDVLIELDGIQPALSCRNSRKIKLYLNVMETNI
jgi:hypothetical protein